MEFDRQDQVDEHSEEVHGISSPNQLKTLHTIKVDAKLPFFIDQALDIEQVGPDERGNIINGIFTRCVSRGVVKKSTSKGNMDLKFGIFD